MAAEYTPNCGLLDQGDWAYHCCTHRAGVAAAHVAWSRLRRCWGVFHTSRSVTVLVLCEHCLQKSDASWAISEHIEVLPDETCVKRLCGTLGGFWRTLLATQSLHTARRADWHFRHVIVLVAAPTAGWVGGALAENSHFRGFVSQPLGQGSCGMLLQASCLVGLLKLRPCLHVCRVYFASARGTFCACMRASPRRFFWQCHGGLLAASCQ